MVILKGVYLAEDLVQKGRSRAKMKHLSFSKYVENLIAKDLYGTKLKLEEGLNDNRTNS